MGNYGDECALTDGQSIKTIELYRSLIEFYGKKNVGKVNLYKKNKILLAVSLLMHLIKSKNIIVLVSKNGRKTVIPFLVFFNKVFRKKIFHSLIGSTTHQTLEDNPKFIKIFNELTGNWSETNTEKKLLERNGLHNVTVVKNFKQLKILSLDELQDVSSEPFRICTFSRVEEKKGISNIVRAVKKVNEIKGRTVCTLDIYGKVMDHYKKDFNKLKEDFGETICYRGVIDFDKSVQILKNYYMVAFPTKYYTEGIPGTILDAFAAGVPVLSAEWESCHDIINERVGIIYEFDNDEALVEALVYAVEHPFLVYQMKKNCLLEAKKYTPEEVVKDIVRYFERE